MSAALEAKGLVCGFGAREVVRVDGLALEAGDAVSIVGLNGAGKSTLLRTLCAQLRPIAGEVSVHGVSLASLSQKERARRVSYLPQTQDIDPSLTVTELVRLGRTPYARGFGHLDAADLRAIDEALELCRLRELEHRRLGELSGGERQRARLAMVTAQETPVVLLDEPTTHLDMAQRYALHGLVAELRRERKTAFAGVFHALADAERFAQTMVLIEAGRAVVFGPSERAAARGALLASSGIPADWIY